jgi:hypothetical protein
MQTNMNLAKERLEMPVCAEYSYCSVLVKCTFCYPTFILISFQSECKTLAVYMANKYVYMVNKYVYMVNKYVYMVNKYVYMVNKCVYMVNKYVF